MSGSTFNIGITLGSAIGGILLTTSTSTGLVAASTVAAAVVLAVTVLPRWLPADRPDGDRPR